MLQAKKFVSEKKGDWNERELHKAGVKRDRKREQENILKEFWQILEKFELIGGDIEKYYQKQVLMHYLRNTISETMH